MTIFTRSDDVIPSGVRRLSLNSSWETLALCKAGLLVKSFEISSSLQPHFLRTSKGLSLTPSTRCFTSLTHNVEHLVVMVADKWFLLTKLELVESNLIKDNRFIFPVECISIKSKLSPIIKQHRQWHLTSVIRCFKNSEKTVSHQRWREGGGGSDGEWSCDDDAHHSEFSDQVLRRLCLCPSESEARVIVVRNISWCKLLEHSVSVTYWNDVVL